MLTGGKNCKDRGFRSLFIDTARSERVKSDRVRTAVRMICVLRDGLTERKNINLLDDKGIYDQCQESFLFLNKQPGTR
jgi:hypothetical protein